jgi:hypothetical protein
VYLAPTASVYTRSLQPAECMLMLFGHQYCRLAEDAVNLQRQTKSFQDMANQEIFASCRT